MLDEPGINLPEPILVPRLQVGFPVKGIERHVLEECELVDVGRPRLGQVRESVSDRPSASTERPQDVALSQTFFVQPTHDQDIVARVPRLVLIFPYKLTGNRVRKGERLVGNIHGIDEDIVKGEVILPNVSRVVAVEVRHQLGEKHVPVARRLRENPCWVAGGRLHFFLQVRHLVTVTEGQNDFLAGASLQHVIQSLARFADLRGLERAAGPQGEARVAVYLLLAPDKGGCPGLFDIQGSRSIAELATQSELRGQLALNRLDAEDENIVVRGNLLLQHGIADPKIIRLHIRSPHAPGDLVFRGQGPTTRILEGKDRRHGGHLVEFTLRNGQRKKLENLQSRLDRSRGRDA